GIDAQALEHGHDDAALLLEQRKQQVHRSDLRITTGAGEPLGGRDGFLGLDGETVWTHLTRLIGIFTPPCSLGTRACLGCGWYGTISNRNERRTRSISVRISCSM